jgi:hypothetical protein
MRPQPVRSNPLKKSRRYLDLLEVQKRVNCVNTSEIYNVRNAQDVSRRKKKRKEEPHPLGI